MKHSRFVRILVGTVLFFIIASAAQAADEKVKVFILAEALDTSPGLALTPPMGWNSWNAFETDINEEKIRSIADAMVTSGMREAGYTYLVIDDGFNRKRNRHRA